MKIGLIAMSGVRAHNEELTRLGLTLPGFVEREVQITFLTAFPGTPLYQRFKREGRLIQPEAWELCTLFDINFRPKNMSVAELQSGFLDLAAQLYSDDETRQRRRQFKQRLRHSPRRSSVCLTC